MALFPHIWAIPLLLLIGAFCGWYLRSHVEEQRKHSTPPPSHLDEE